MAKRVIDSQAREALLKYIGRHCIRGLDYTRYQSLLREVREIVKRDRIKQKEVGGET